MTVEYASQAYWETRLAAERNAGFEWLAPSQVLLPVIHHILLPVLGGRSVDDGPLRLLHFGCGSSTLGTDIQNFLGRRVAVSDCDFASNSLVDDLGEGDRHSYTSTAPVVPLLQADVLDREALEETMPPGGWDILLDKSTADAISCGPSVSTSPSSGDEREAIEELCCNLRQVCSPQCRWISISYSSSRFDFLSTQGSSQWRVLERLPVTLTPEVTSTDEGIVYRPQTGVWAWVLSPI